MPKNPNSRIKPTVYKRIKNVQGICTIWDLNPKTLKYEQRQHGTKYYAFKRVQNRQISRCFDSFNEAKDWRSSPFIYAEKVATGVTFAEIKNLFFKTKREGKELSVTTLETYESSAKHLAFFNDLPMEQINTPAVDHWIKAVKHPDYLSLQHRTRISYRHELSVLRQILTFYSEYECDSYQVPIKKRHLKDCVVDAEKLKQRKQKSKQRFIPREDLLKFLEALERISNGKVRYEAIYLVGLLQMWTGVRIGEAAAVRVEDFDFERRTVRIWQTVHWARSKARKTCVSPLTKTGEQREVPVPAFVIQVICSWLKGLKRVRGLVFSESGKDALPYRSIQYRYDLAFKNAKVHWSSTHILRHSFATDFLEKTRDKEALQGILGHSSSKQTEHYAKITDEMVAQGMKRYETSMEPEHATVLPFRRAGEPTIERNDQKQVDMSRDSKREPKPV